MSIETLAIEVVNAVFQKLADEALNRIVRSQGIHNELKVLKSKLTRIQEWLNDASEKEVREKSVKEWLDGLQNLAYDIDDFLDDLATEAMHRELTQGSRASTSKVRMLIPPCCTNFSRNNRLFPKLDSFNKELEYLEKTNPGLVKKDEKPKVTRRTNETSLPDASSVIGRKGETEKFLNKLLRDEPCKENFTILPIVGMGGVGKTTLARLLYNDTQVRDRFELHVWVCVSDNQDIYNISMISKIIYQDVSGENKEFVDLNQLQVALRNKLKDKRFILVLDDVWNGNYDDWENLVRPFHSCAPESRIIITTRKEELLLNLGFDHLDRLESLSHEDALCLFALHALGVDNFDMHETIKTQAEGIVKKCSGLPLALRALGRMMRTKTHEEDWDYVLNSDIWDLGNVDEIVPGLRLSYHDLDANLKQLFAYCSLFPKGFLFDKEELVLLWMAEGFLNPENTHKSPEYLGQEYFEILLSRSFFQQAPNEESLFIMHDLLNDLATLVAGGFYITYDMKFQKENLANYRYMSFIREGYVGYYEFEAFKGAKSLRTLLAVNLEDESWDSCYLSNKILVDLLPKLPLLRVLSLSNFMINEVPEVIGSLKHLRYLNLSQTKVKELPENVGNLYNLQTLILFGCKMLSKLPKSFLNLKKLRHFDIRDTPLLNKMPIGISELENLQTLTNIMIGVESNFEITDLKGLKNLHGYISIDGLHNVQSVKHAKEANAALKKITELELKWVDVFDGSRQAPLEKEVLNELKPHSNKLKRLGIEWYGGIEFPNWIGDPSFHELVHVSLTNCGNCISLPSLGQLPSLKELYIQGMNGVKVIGLEFIGTTLVAFPSLQILGFEDMLGWEAWLTNSEVSDVVFPCIQEIQLKKCPSLIKFSLKSIPSLRVLEIRECEDCVLRSMVQAASSITELKIKSITRLTDVAWRGVMEYFGKVEVLRIKKCNEIRFLWESQLKASKVLINLKKLEVAKCSNILSLGEKEEVDDNLGKNLLSSFRILKVRRCYSMLHCWCPDSIEKLSMFSCISVTRVSTGGGWHKLKSLEISLCYNITEMANNTSMPMLEYLWIYNWENLKSVIQFNNYLVHLTDLHIFDCPSIESFPSLSNLNLLRRVTVRNCSSIDASFPRGLWPPELVRLEIGRLKKPITEWGDQNFPTSLVQLTLFGEDVRNFSQLPDLFPSSLSTLRIKEFENLESLSMGLQHLTSLQHLHIVKCPKMKHLPKSLLPSLLSLEISESCELRRRCNKRGSHYWPLISHIPSIKMQD